MVLLIYLKENISFFVHHFVHRVHLALPLLSEFVEFTRFVKGGV